MPLLRPPSRRKLKADTHKVEAPSNFRKAGDKEHLEFL
jgi:hypothetical protein